MNIIATDIPDVLIIETKLLGDQRRFLPGNLSVPPLRRVGVRRSFVQDNMPRSSYGVLRGLHLQNPSPQGDLISVLRGRVLEVAVDVRIASPNFGRHVAVE